MIVDQLLGGVQPLENCWGKPDGANGDQPARGILLILIIIIIIIIIIIVIAIIIVTIIIVTIIMKQGSTSDAEMLAEAAMLREHRNRLENRMVTITNRHCKHLAIIGIDIIIPTITLLLDVTDPQIRNIVRSSRGKCQI